MQHTPDTIWTVSSLNHEIKTLLEKGVGTIWIEGEISNFARPASGHWYFTLKDERAQLRAAMFRNRNGRAGFIPSNGQQVLTRAQVTLYEARGDYQIIVEHLEEAGTGLLMRRFEAMKQKLANEGLFDDRHKKALPAHARHIGIITSASGAAIRDALSVIRRRSPSTQVTLFASQVQGEQAAPQIVQAIEAANRFAQCDVLLLIRGGGSLEDLWCFNEESVARAMCASNTPIVSGIGHEIDYSIADFVADRRAPTPSVAAETVTTDQHELMTRIDLLQGRLLRSHRQQLEAVMQRFANLHQRLLAHHPQRRMESQQQRLDYARQRLLGVQQQSLHNLRQRHSRCIERVSQQHPGKQTKSVKQTIHNLQHRLALAAQSRVESSRHQLTLQARSLDNLSPLKTLSRGYAAVSRNNTIITQATQLEPQDEVTIRFSDGHKQASIL